MGKFLYDPGGVVLTSDFGTRSLAKNLSVEIVHNSAVTS